jgi:N-formylglutamate amidohydrolase
MSSEPAAATPIDPPFAVTAPPQQTAAVVFASPHSGNRYPPGFVTASRLDALTLRRSEDAFIDELFAGAPGKGAPLLKAFFPRAYIDPNREPWELDPTMFADALPSYVNGASPRVSAGLGTIARVVANGAEIYRGKLSFADARVRIETLYWPYHETLQGLLNATHERFGRSLLIDCHSMPSVGGPMDRDPGKRRVDFVLGDCFGASCAPAVMREAESHLRKQGFAVARNDPYAGGFTTRHYGQPSRGRHALQIEINRGLYMDELRIERSAGFAALKRALDHFVDALAGIAAALPRI